MTPGRAAALRAAQIYTSAQIANTSLYDLYKVRNTACPSQEQACKLKHSGGGSCTRWLVCSSQALEAAEPALLAPAEREEQRDHVWGSEIFRQRARLLAVSMKLKDAAQKEHDMRVQVCLSK